MKPVVLLSFRLADADVAAIGEWAEPLVPASAAELSQLLQRAEGVLLSNQVAVDAAFLDGAPQLRAVSLVGVGYDRVDLEAVAARSVLVANTPGVLTDAVADLTLGLIIAVARGFPDAFAVGRSPGWGSLRLGSDLRGATLALVGFGRIGRAVATRALAFGMRVVATDAFVVAPMDGVPLLAFDEALALGDVVSVHVDLNMSSRGLIGERELSLMKRSAFLVNTSRGPTVDQRALASALRDGRLAGAALDVLETEPPGADEPLLSMPNVIVVPHIGSATVQTRRAMLELAIANLRACVVDGRCACLVT